MENQHRHIKGYRELNQDEIDLMNEIKEKAAEVGELCERLYGLDALYCKAWIFLNVMQDVENRSCAQKEDLSAAEAKLSRIANIVHHGGLIGFEDQLEALKEVRKLTVDNWDTFECERLQRQSTS